MFRKTTTLLWTLLVVLTIAVVMGRGTETSEQENFHQNQLEFQPEDPMLEDALIRYLLTKDWLNRARPREVLDERQKKKSYWKQCAFNAVSCFGK